MLLGSNDFLRREKERLVSPFEVSRIGDLLIIWAPGGTPYLLNVRYIESIQPDFADLGVGEDGVVKTLPLCVIRMFDGEGSKAHTIKLAVEDEQKLTNLLNEIVKALEQDTRATPPIPINTTSIESCSSCGGCHQDIVVIPGADGLGYTICPNKGWIVVVRAVGGDA